LNDIFTVLLVFFFAGKKIEAFWDIMIKRKKKQLLSFLCFWKYLNDLKGKSTITAIFFMVWLKWKKTAEKPKCRNKLIDLELDGFFSGNTEAFMAFAKHQEDIIVVLLSQEYIKLEIQENPGWEIFILGKKKERICLLLSFNDMTVFS
jgi:hypothetical protein